MPEPVVLQPTSSTPTPAAPVYSDVASAIDSIIGETVAASVAEYPDTEEQAAERDEKGRFVAKPKDGEEPVVVEGDTVAEAPDEPEPIVLPEGMAAVPKIEGRELATAFKLMDKDGELEVPDVTIEFEANGKTRREPIDKVVKFAQWGVYNHEREQQLLAKADQVQQKEAHYTQIEARARQSDQERERLLTDPDYLVAEMLKYEQGNTPEAKLQREREQFAKDREQAQFNDWNAKGEQFFHAELLPAIETITKALPNVSPEEIGARILLLQERHRVATPFGSIVPPEKYAAVKQAIIADVVPWAEQVHAARTQTIDAKTTAAQQETAKAKAAKQAAEVQAQKKTNLIGRTVRPGARSPQGTSTTNAPSKKPITNVEDAEADAISSAVAAAMAGG